MKFSELTDPQKRDFYELLGITNRLAEMSHRGDDLERDLRRLGRIASALSMPKRLGRKGRTSGDMIDEALWASYLDMEPAAPGEHRNITVERLRLHGAPKAEFLGMIAHHPNDFAKRLGDRLRLKLQITVDKDIERVTIRRIA